MANILNINVLSEIVSYLNVLEDNEILNHITETCKLTGKEVTIIKDHWVKHTKYMRTKTLIRIDNDEYDFDFVEDPIGKFVYITRWYVNDKLHRDYDLPAVRYSNGKKIWYKNGLRQRDNDLPAIELPTGTKEWCKHDKIHRDNDLPAIVLSDGTKKWFKHGKLHRDNGKPAIEHVDGSCEWWINGERVK